MQRAHHQRRLNPDPWYVGHHLSGGEGARGLAHPYVQHWLTGKQLGGLAFLMQTRLVSCYWTSVLRPELQLKIGLCGRSSQTLTHYLLF